MACTAASAFVLVCAWASKRLMLCRARISSTRSTLPLTAVGTDSKVNPMALMPLSVKPATMSGNFSVAAMRPAVISGVAQLNSGHMRSA